MWLQGCTYFLLVHFEATVDVSDEGQRCPERYAAQHKREDHSREERVTKELSALDWPAHRRPVSVVKNGVNKNKEASGAGVEYASPPPAVVLAR